MKQGLILLLSVCMFAAAMVPRDRRAVNTEEEEERLMSQSTTDKSMEKPICASQTPCAWTIYKPITRYEEMNITNSYCKCSEGTTCQKNEDDWSVSAYVYRCRPPANVEIEEAADDS